MINYLNDYRTLAPEWLRRFDPTRRTKATKESAISDFLQSERLVFYPGSGTDGQPTTIFSQSHAAHTFLYVDYTTTRERVLSQLDARPWPAKPVNQGTGFTGYRSMARYEYALEEVIPDFQSGLSETEQQQRRELKLNLLGPIVSAIVAPYVILEILSRDPGFGDQHGPERLALLILGIDAIDAFDRLFCQTVKRNLFAIVIEDYGWGMQYTKFGHHPADNDPEYLRLLAQRYQVLPEFMLFGEGNGAEPWPGYSVVQEAEPISHFNRWRYLLRKNA